MLDYILNNQKQFCLCSILEKNVNLKMWSRLKKKLYLISLGNIFCTECLPKISNKLFIFLVYIKNFLLLYLIFKPVLTLANFITLIIFGSFRAISGHRIVNGYLTGHFWHLLHYTELLRHLVYTLLYQQDQLIYSYSLFFPQWTPSICSDIPVEPVDIFLFIILAMVDTLYLLWYTRSTI